MKTMVKAIAAGIAIAIIAYIALPESRELVITFTPIMLVLICPVMMIGMMWMMRAKDSSLAPKSVDPDPSALGGQAPAAATQKIWKDNRN